MPPLADIDPDVERGSLVHVPSSPVMRVRGADMDRAGPSRRSPAHPRCVIRAGPASRGGLHHKLCVPAVAEVWPTVSVRWPGATKWVGSRPASIHRIMGGPGAAAPRPPRSLIRDEVGRTGRE